ncbi:retrotransposon protein, putative, ty1-copia subclass [Tanacetum coccineum]
MLIYSIEPELLKKIKSSWVSDVDVQILIQKIESENVPNMKFTWENGELRRKEKLVIGNDDALRTQLIAVFHNEPMGGHSGMQVWRDVSMDFIDGLPNSQCKTVILDIVERLSKHAHFMALSHPYTTTHVAQAFLDNKCKTKEIDMGTFPTSNEDVLIAEELVNILDTRTKRGNAATVCVLVQWANGTVDDAAWDFVCNTLEGDTTQKLVSFHTLVTLAGNGADVVIQIESIYVVNERLSNTVYGFFLGNHVVYPVVENYVMNTWSKFGLVKSMMTKVDTGCDVNIMIEDVCNVPVLASYARAMLELRADVELKDTIMVVVPKFVGEGYHMKTIRVRYEWTPPRCSNCKVFGHVLDEFPKQPVSDVLKNLKNPRQAGRGVQNDDDMGTNGGNSKVDDKGANSDVVSSTHRSLPVASVIVIELAYDESTQFMARGGAIDASLYEDEYYDIYDTYDIKGLTKKDLAFCDMMDINLRGRGRR